MMKVENMMSAHGNKVANQFIISGNGKTTFQSYDTVIAEIDWINEHISISEKYNYSPTTNKYRNAFFRDEHFPEIATLAAIRKAIERGNTYDDMTGYTIAIRTDW